jgi:transposase
MLFVGVDVAKLELVVSDGSKVWKAANTKQGIAKLLKGLPKEALVAMESTSSYHLPLADAAFEAGFTVYVLNPKHVKRYRDSLPVRGKTDPIDAQVIADYALREHSRLRPYQPMPQDLRKLKTLLGRRSRLVCAKTRICLSLEGVKELKAELKAIIGRIDQAICRIDEMVGLLAAGEDYDRLQSIPGVGKTTGAGLLASLSQGEFRSADKFVAFLGLDLVANDSGQKMGKRRLSKLGDSETRRLVFLCAFSATRTRAWKPIYDAYRTRLSATAALVALSRRIVRTAWSIYTHGTEFAEKRIQTLT